MVKLMAMGEFICEDVVGDSSLSLLFVAHLGCVYQATFFDILKNSVSSDYKEQGW